MKTQNFQNVFWWIITILALVVTPLLGTVAGIAIMGIAILATPMVFSPIAFSAIKNQPMLIMFTLGFLLFALVSALTATELADMRFLANFIPFILAIPIYLIATNKAGKRAAILLLSLCLIGASISFVIAIHDVYFRHTARAIGYYSGAIIFARNVAALGFLATMGFVLTTGPKRYVFLLGPIITIITIFLSQSRGIIIVIPVLGLMLAIFILRQIQSKKIKLFLGLATLGIIAAIIALFISGGAVRIATLFAIVPDVLKNGTSGIRSIDVRIEFYQTGWELFQQSLWIGHGWAHMSDHVYTILDSANYPAILIDQFHFHNDFFNFAVSGGIIGISIWLLFLLGPLIGALKSTRDSLYRIRLELISLLLVLYFISGLTDMVIGYDLPTMMYATLSALILGAVRDEKII